MRWEYYRLSVDGPNVENALYTLGQDGWELVAVIPETRIFFGFQCFLKRPLAEGAAPASPPERTTEPRRQERFASSRSTLPSRTPRIEDSADTIAGRSPTR